MFRSLKVALAHDWLTGMRGGEKVLEVFANLFPSAPIHTMVHVPGSVSEAIESHPIITSPLQRLPWGTKKYRYWLPLMPRLVERIRVAPVDLVISVSTCVAKGIVPPDGALHASYINAPMRYLHDRYDEYFSPARASLPTRLAARLVRKRLQDWDIAGASRIDSLVGNSSFIAERIRRIYGRPARVIHPPVDVHRFATARREPDDYYLMVCALVPYKNVDLAVEAFRGLDRRLVLVGDGPMRGRLAANRPPNVELRGWASDEEVVDLVAGCRAFLLPNVEDFGIAPVEAMAAGRPVIALGKGGALDTVRDVRLSNANRHDDRFGPTGLLYAEDSAAGLAAAITAFERREFAFDSDNLARWARTFDLPRFEREVKDWIRSVIEPPALSKAA